MAENRYELNKQLAQMLKGGVRSVYKELHADRETGC